VEFQRQILDDLRKWRDLPKRKPALIMGARQIGKTTALLAFAKSDYEDYLYLNFERQTDIHQFFTGSKNPRDILDNLSLVHGKEIVPGKTLIILDEIQECRDAIIALKYFEEELPAISIIGAGSLLGLSIGNDRSFPVGKVAFFDMHPLTFTEYLAEADKKKHKQLQHLLDAKEIAPIEDAFYTPLQEAFKEYLLLGGMPEVAAQYLQDRNIEEAQKTQDEILRAYELDFVKHASKATSAKIQRVWNALPTQLARENKKFLYKAIRSGARAREYEEAVDWLIQAGLVNRVARIEKAGIPLKAYEDLSAFKLYVFETGLLIRLAGLDPTTFINDDQFFTEFKGSIAENFVAHALRKSYGRSPYYWTSTGKAEVDFVIEQKGNCIPVEVKSGTATKSKSLAVFKSKYAPKLRVRISNSNLSLTDDLLNIPLFLAEYVDLFIRNALKQLT